MITLGVSSKLWRDLECLGLRFGIRIISSKKRERANLSVGFIKYYIIKKSERVDIGRYLHAFLISTLDGSKCSPPHSSLLILTTCPLMHQATNSMRPQPSTLQPPYPYDMSLHALGHKFNIIQCQTIAPGSVWSFRIKLDSLKSYHCCMLYWSLLF